MGSEQQRSHAINSNIMKIIISIRLEGNILLSSERSKHYHIHAYDGVCVEETAR